MQWGRVIVGYCIQLTPPMNFASRLSESGKAQQTVGLNAVRSGVNRAFQVWKDTMTARKDPSLYAGINRTIRKRNWRKADELIRKIARIKGVGPEATPELHNSFRIKGRVPKNQYPFIVPGQVSINKLLRRRQSKVGFAKSGWIPAFLRLGGNLARVGNKRSSFTWLRGKGGESFGGITVPSSKNPEMLVWNGVPYIQEAGRERRIIEDAFKNAIRNMTKQTEIIMAKRMSGRLR
jgi:hypothetical protein